MDNNRLGKYYITRTGSLDISRTLNRPREETRALTVPPRVIEESESGSPSLMSLTPPTPYDETQQSLTDFQMPSTVRRETTPSTSSQETDFQTPSIQETVPSSVSQETDFQAPSMQETVPSSVSQETDFQTPSMQETDFQTPSMQETDFQTPSMQETDFQTPSIQETDFQTPSMDRKETPLSVQEESLSDTEGLSSSALPTPLRNYKPPVRPIRSPGIKYVDDRPVDNTRTTQVMKFLGFKKDPDNLEIRKQPEEYTPESTQSTERTKKFRRRKADIHINDTPIDESKLMDSGETGETPVRDTIETEDIMLNFRREPRKRVSPSNLTERELSSYEHTPTPPKIEPSSYTYDDSLEQRIEHTEEMMNTVMDRLDYTEQSVDYLSQQLENMSYGIQQDQEYFDRKLAEVDELTRQAFLEKDAKREEEKQRRRERLEERRKKIQETKDRATQFLKEMEGVNSLD